MAPAAGSAAGHDESFVDSWDSFHDCVAKMTKSGETYGCGIGIQIGGYGEWYQRLRAAGGSYLTADRKQPNVNLPNVVAMTQQMAALFKDGIAPPLGTYSYDAAPAAFAAGKLAILSSDLATIVLFFLKPLAGLFSQVAQLQSRRSESAHDGAGRHV